MLDAFLDFLNDYLSPREGRVTVEDAISDVFRDTVFQGAILGPCLWNAFFGDVASEIATGDQIANVFADDLSVSAHCPQEVSNDTLLDTLSTVQHRAIVGVLAIR